MHPRHIGEVMLRMGIQPPRKGRQGEARAPVRWPLLRSSTYLAPFSLKPPF